MKEGICPKCKTELIFNEDEQSSKVPITCPKCNYEFNLSGIKPKQGKYRSCLLTVLVLLLLFSCCAISGNPSNDGSAIQSVIVAIFMPLFGIAAMSVPLLIIYLLIKLLEAAASGPSLTVRRGSHGERRVATLLSELDSSVYTVFNDVLIVKDGKSTQIDHIVVSRFGLFVIETKNINGWVWANPKHQNWTITYRRGRKMKMYNPIFQNLSHIRALKKHLPNGGNLWPISIICFLSGATFRTNIPVNVIYTKELVDYIKSHDELKLDDSTVSSVIQELSTLINYSEEERVEHLSYANSIKTSRN